MMDSTSDTIKMVFYVSISSEMARDCPFIPSDDKARAIRRLLLLNLSLGFLKNQNRKHKETYQILLI
jgi:hypothetical protein